MTKEERAKMLKKIMNNPDVKAFIKQLNELKSKDKIGYISVLKELKTEVKSMGVGC